MVRNQLFVRFDGEEHDRRHPRREPAARARSTSTRRWSLDHAAGGCQSREMFKSVLDGESRGVFQGKIIVRPDAQKTDAKMMTQALLLSDEAEADNKPELEIFADDVECGHGATAGALDDDLLFYLRARGIPRTEAEALLIQAFVGEAVEGIEHAGLREALMEQRRRMAQARGSEPMHPAVTNGAYDVDRIRADFPILAMQVYGKPLVYLDNAASAQKPKAVLDRIQQAYTDEYANVHRGLHYLANAATEAYEGAREKVRAFLNAPRHEEIIFTRNATEAINLVAYTFGARAHQGGRRDRALDHGAPFQHRALAFPARAAGRGDQVGAGRRRRQFPASTNSRSCSTPRTKMVAITHMSNALGTIVPVKEVVQLAHARGIPVLVDGSQARRASRRSTCRTSAATSTSSPATSSTGRPASACSRASTSISTPCRRSTAAAR